MNRLELFAGCKEVDIIDMLELRKRQPVLEAVPIDRLYRLWGEFSSYNCARWLIINDEQVERFMGWMRGE